MPFRRRGSSRDGHERQVTFEWSHPAEILETAAFRGGDVVYESPEVTRIVRRRAPRLPKVRAARAARDSYGLPFGVREVDGRLVCWSCTRELKDDDLVRVKPGLVTCPGCGACLPFAE